MTDTAERAEQGSGRPIVQIPVGELRPGQFVFDPDQGDWVEVVDASARFGAALVTVEDSSGGRSTWPLPRSLMVTVEG